MSPEDFRKISHPEPKILNSLVNCTRTHAQTHTLTWVNLELTTRGGSANKENRNDNGRYLCDLCESETDEYTHVLLCETYKNLREGKSLDNDKINWSEEEPGV